MLGYKTNKILFGCFSWFLDVLVFFYNTGISMKEEKMINGRRLSINIKESEGRQRRIK